MPQNTHKALIIAQLSDLHLSGNIGVDPSYQRFSACLRLALDCKPNFLLLTGDLVNDGKASGYDWLLTQLKKTKLPFACLAGNHDVSCEHNSHLPFDQRYLSPVAADQRLITCRRIVLGSWQLLLLSSAVPGQIYGHIQAQTLNWLQIMLQKHPNPAIIALHHHPRKVHSRWIDAHRLQNEGALAQTLQPFPHVRGVVCGHVHQAHALPYANSVLYTCPAVGRQFLPFADEFAQDDSSGGLRLLLLGKDKLRSRICRLPCNKTNIDF